MPKINHSHWVGGPPCDLPTKKACDERYYNWQADAQVALAVHLVDIGNADHFRRDNSVFGQLVLVMAGLRETITNGDGVQTENAWGRRILEAVERYRTEAATAEREVK